MCRSARMWTGFQEKPSIRFIQFLAHLSQIRFIQFFFFPFTFVSCCVNSVMSKDRVLSDFWIFSWTELNETWKDARYQCPLPSLCFSGRSEKQDGRPGLSLAETFWTSPLKPLSGIQRNLTGSKISKPSTKFVFFGPIGKTRWPPWPLIARDIFDFSSETAERNSTKLDGKQDINAFYQVCVFRTDPKNNMATLASDWLRHILTFPLKLLHGIQRNFDRKQDLNVLYQVCGFRAEKWIKIATLANSSKKVAHFKNFFSPEGYSNKPNA